MRCSLVSQYFFHDTGLYDRRLKLPGRLLPVGGAGGGKTPGADKPPPPSTLR